VSIALHPSAFGPLSRRGLWTQARRLLFVGLGPISSLVRGLVSARRKARRDFEEKYRHKARVELRLMEGRNAPGNPINPLMFVSAGLSAFAFIDQSILNLRMGGAQEPPAGGGSRRLLPEPATPGAEALLNRSGAAVSSRPQAGTATEPNLPVNGGTTPAGAPQASVELSDGAGDD
jgi:hypothetical protein